MENKEMICGFQVKQFPQKPDYLPITQKEFKQNTLAAWCGNGDKDLRIAAVFHGGQQEWDVLCKDESLSVRGAVACHSSEQHQLVLANDPEPLVRKQLAIYGTDRVRNALLEHDENDPEVLVHIAKFGSISIRHRLVDTAWDHPEILRQIVQYLPARDIEKLLTHPQMEVRMSAARHGNRSQCLRVLNMPCPSQCTTLRYMRYGLIERIKDLDEVAQALGQPPTRIRNMEMELST